MKVLLGGVLASFLVFSACRPAPPPPLLQRGYLWQRDWTPAVLKAFSEAEKRMEGVVILGAEIVWKAGRPVAIHADIPWETLRFQKKPLALAVRIAPVLGGSATDDATAREIVTIVKSLLQSAKDHGVQLTEFQLDFDCPQKRLADYRRWLQALKPVVAPLPFAITTLPAWLDEPAFPKLAREVDSTILQVHSVPTAQETGRSELCDTALARKWIGKMEKLGLPFSVALPTYRCIAGYNPAGKLVGVYMDGVQPVWGNDVHFLEFGADPDAISALVGELQKDRGRGFRELLWYRVPVASDGRNWPWSTLSAVMAGRAPKHRLQVEHNEGSLVDFSIVNTGEVEEKLGQPVEITWKTGNVQPAEALPGWRVETQARRAVFFPEPASSLRLSPEQKLSIGWLRYDSATSLQTRFLAPR